LAKIAEILASFGFTRSQAFATIRVMVVG